MREHEKGDRGGGGGRERRQKKIDRERGEREAEIKERITIVTRIITIIIGTVVKITTAHVNDKEHDGDHKSDSKF